MKKKVFRSIFLSSLLVLVLTIFNTISVMYKIYSDEVKSEVRSEAEYIGNAVMVLGENQEKALEYLSQTGRKSKNRITYINSDGTVLYDSFISASELDNHLDRPEIETAMHDGSGEITRASDTFGTETYYYAFNAYENNIVRIACDTKNIFGLIKNTLWLIILISIFIIILSFIITLFLTKSVIKPINRIDLNHPLENETYEELSPLLVKMAHQNKQIEAQIEGLSKSKNEFEYITSNMSEGLVIISDAGAVVSANKSARKILSGNADGSYLQLCRDNNYIHAVEKALAGSKAECRLEHNGRIYHLTVNPVESDNSGFGAVVFIVDITERELSDKMRREFSANVSHELKTPLTSIMGYAEIISNGIAQKGDIPHFAGMIHTESARLLTLIEDIIKLSQLDEEGQLQDRFEKIELSEICRNVADELASKAKSLGITLSCSCQKAEINGFKPVIHEMIYNLCDNAIIYNKKGGKADITLENTEKDIVLTVSDNGIGIPPEHQSRVFERFYRVDKSHSKETGGTGLGLSIVRHGAMLHNAEIKLKSIAGKGTEIKIIFNNTVH